MSNDQLISDIIKALDQEDVLQISELSKLEKVQNDLLSKLNKNQEIYDHSVENMGLWTKITAGLLGGNKELVVKANDAADVINETERRLNEIEKLLASKKKAVNQVLLNALSSQSQEFKKKSEQYEVLDNFVTANSKFIDFVQVAHSGVKDALLWLSWEKLVNHRDAKEKLQEFRAKLSRHQFLIDKVYEVLNEEQFNIQLESLIKFSNQHEGMQSFNDILQTLNKQQSVSKPLLDKIQDEFDSVFIGIIADVTS